MAQRDWIFMGIGFGIGFFVLTTIGRKTMMTAAGMGKAEAERVLAKIEKRSKTRIKI